MKIVTPDQMRGIDNVSIHERGIPGAELMDRAGKAVAREVVDRFAPESVAVLAGKGNNGGDGFVAARTLHRMGVKTAVFLLADPADYRGDAQAAFSKMPDEIETVRVEAAHDLREKLIQYDVVLDGILGTGLRGPVEGFLGEAIEAVNSCQTNVVAIDVPSGLICDGTGDAEAPESAASSCVRAQLTITIGLPKVGLVVEPGIRQAGLVTIADIGFPSDLLEDPAITLNLLTEATIAAQLPERNPAGHKGTFGRVLVLGGSEGMTGAAILAARAAVRSGAGLVYSAYPESLGTIMETNLIEPVKRPLRGSALHFEESMAEAALEMASEVDAVALGPGIGRDPSTARFVQAMIERVAAPMVIDADALNLLSGNLDWLRSRPGPTVLTPHPGEAARLLQTSTDAIQASRLTAFTEFAETYGVVTVLKGAQSVVTSPEGQRYLNPTGNSGLAKGGSGDVLTGLIGGLLAQGCSATAAAQIGVFLHGVAADRAADKIGVRAMAPSDLIDYLGEAFRYVEEAAR